MINMLTKYYKLIQKMVMRSEAVSLEAARASHIGKEEINFSWWRGRRGCPVNVEAEVVASSLAPRSAEAACASHIGKENLKFLFLWWRGRRGCPGNVEAEVVASSLASRPAEAACA